MKNFQVDGWSGWPTTVAGLGGRTVVLAGQHKRVSLETDEIRAHSPVGRLRSKAE
ncbi:hypothetical protein GCM10010302_09680 [Streptomyces polychromogenes]|uniref:Uncharacterized protein n=1 Tax=Streptomyces polychromogenes TaxID=67342 RepID=A0ABP3ETS6_9ACTN